MLIAFSKIQEEIAKEQIRFSCQVYENVPVKWFAELADGRNAVLWHGKWH